MNRNERALKIAGYEGWWKVLGRYVRDEDRMIGSDLIPKYSTADGLNKSIFIIRPFAYIEINFAIEKVYITIRKTDKAENYDFTNPETLIDALQKAILFYYENKD